MEYSIHLTASAPDLCRIVEALQAVDPSALADLDPVTHTLRVSATMLDRELLDALAQSGYPTAPDHIVRLPSVCCGGCGG